MATSSIPESPEIVNPNLRALDVVSRLNRYDPDEVRRSLEQAEAHYPLRDRQTPAQRISRLARVVGESFNHVNPDVDNSQEVK